ncbi:Putative LOC100205425, partial [Caligus rogercresseyi]
MQNGNEPQQSGVTVHLNRSKELKTSIPNPQEETNNVYLLFDLMHNYKNIYNLSINAQKLWDLQTKFSPPQGDSLQGKTRVKLADVVFHESSIGALKYYAKEGSRPEFKDTALFLEFVRTMWNILSVKTPRVGYKKRNELRLMVVRDTPPESITIDVPTNHHVDLKEFINIMSRRGLSTPSDLLYLSCLYADS